MQPPRLLYPDLPESPENRVLLDDFHPADWRNPSPADIYDLVVVGGGPAGIVAAKTAAILKKRVALIERDLVGGDCFNIGCIPSKTIIRASRLYADMRYAKNFGGQRPQGINVDFPALMKHMRTVRSRVSKHISIRQLKKEGVDIFLGTAAFAGTHAVGVPGAVLNFKKAFVATGSRPRIPPIPGIENVSYFTNESLFNIEECPRNLLVIGGGPLGCEMAQAFCRLGSQVSIVQRDPMFLTNVERDGAQILSNALARDGVGIYLNAAILDIRVRDGKKIVDLISDDDKRTIEVGHILVSAGRNPTVAGLGLEKAGVRYSHNGIGINDFLQTTNPDIYAAGDVCPERLFNHVQDGAARMAVSNALTSAGKKLSELVMPWCIYTDPEVAHVGLHVREAREQDIHVKTYTILMHQVDRAIADGESEGFVKILVKEEADEIIGATIVSRHAGDIINYISFAMTAGIGLKGLAEASFPYPTQAQAVRKAALACIGNHRK